MQNIITNSSRPIDDGYEQVEMEGDATDEELLLQGIARLTSRIVSNFRRVPESGQLLIGWDKKGRVEKRHISIRAKAETVDHAGAVVIKKPK